MTAAGEKFTVGTVSITDHRLRIGDANFPPVGELVERVPNGQYAVEGMLAGPKETRQLEWFSIDFADGGEPAETVSFAIDGGFVAISDPNIPIPEKCMDRWRRRKQVYREIGAILNNRPAIGTLVDGGRVWAVLFYSGDDIYQFRVSRKDGWVTRIHCDLRDSV